MCNVARGTMRGCAVTAGANGGVYRCRNAARSRVRDLRVGLHGETDRCSDECRALPSDSLPSVMTICLGIFGAKLLLILHPANSQRSSDGGLATHGFSLQRALKHSRAMIAHTTPALVAATGIGLEKRSSAQGLVRAGSSPVRARRRDTRCWC